MEDLLEHWIVRLLAEDCYTHDWVSEGAFSSGHHVVQEMLFQFVSASLVLHFDPDRILNSYFELSTCLSESLVDFVS